MIWLIYIWLVVLTILKNMSSSMGRIIPYIMENNIAMFQTANQLTYINQLYTMRSYETMEHRLKSMFIYH